MHSQFSVKKKCESRKTSTGKLGTYSLKISRIGKNTFLDIIKRKSHCGVFTKAAYAAFAARQDY